MLLQRARPDAVILVDVDARSERFVWIVIPTRITIQKLMMVKMGLLRLIDFYACTTAGKQNLNKNRIEVNKANC